MIAAIVLAAGASSRMGTPKAALPLGAHGGTVLSCGVSSLITAGVPRVVVVAGAHVDAVRQALGIPHPSVTMVEHDGWQKGQLSSLLCGLDALDHPSLEAVLMTLVDVPLVAPDTTRQLIRAWRERGAAIVRPARGDTHGHPVLFDRRVFAALRAADPGRGAKPVVHAYAHDLVNVPVTDEGAFLDLDTPEDYQRILARSLSMSSPGQDPFTGTWVFSGARSTLSTPMPQSWVLQIMASESDVSHREEIVASDGSEMTVVLHAAFDGEDHAVGGSPLMDTMACTRTAPHVIAGTGKKAGAVTLTDTLTASPDGEVLTLTYALFDGNHEVAKGTGIFERRRAESQRDR